MKKISMLLLPLLLFVACENYESVEKQSTDAVELQSRETPPVIQAKQILTPDAPMDTTAITENSWTLLSGTPPYADPNPIVYEGPVSLKGKFVETEIYGNDLGVVFEVSAEDRSKVPDFLKSNYFNIVGYNSEMAPDQEVTILANKLQVNMEGYPVLEVMEY